jgi:group I intron endonuclease
MNNILQNSINVNEIFDEIEKEIYGIIYKITNLITGKIYIGQTTKSIEERFRGHIRWMKHNNKLQYIHKSMKKYRIDNFIIEQIDQAYSLDELNQKEYDLIIQENSLVPNGYNLVNGGGKSGYSPETIEKLRQSKQDLRAIYNEELDQIRYIHINEEIPNGFIAGGKPGFKLTQ